MCVHLVRKERLVKKPKQREREREREREKERSKEGKTYTNIVQ